MFRQPEGKGNSSLALAPKSATLGHVMQSPFSGQLAFGDKSSDPRYGFQNYTIKRKALQMFGATVYLYGPNEQLIMWGKRQAWKLRAEMHFFTDENQTEELIRIVPRSAVNFSATYDVFDARTNQKIGAFARQGLTSMLVQDTWKILDAQDREVGQALEDSAILGLLRRFVEYASLIFPQKFHATVGGMPVATYARHSNPFSSRVDIDFSADGQNALDRRLGVALAMLIEAVERKN